MKAKEAASIRALDFVKEGMHIGLGTGSTATFFIEHLIKKCRAGFKIKAVATSQASEQLAKNGGIPFLDSDAITELDLTVDGADEVDPQKRLIKGAGGALVREKIIANMSKQMIVIADESKLVDHLGEKLLPIEIIPFGRSATKEQIASMGFQGSFRMKGNKAYITDNGNWILDVKLPSPLKNPEEVNLQILKIPGVVDTGFFFHLAQKVIIGKNDGTTLIL